MGQLIGTLFSVNKSLYFPEIMICRIVFNNYRGFFSSTSNLVVAPAAVVTQAATTAGGSALIANTAASGQRNTWTGTATAVQLGGICMLLAAELRPDIIRERMEDLKRGYRIITPFLWRFTNPLSGSTQTASTKLDRIHGLFVRKWVHAVFPQDQKNGWSFANQNDTFDTSGQPTTGVAGTTIPSCGNFVNQYHVEVDSGRQSEYDYFAYLTPPVGQVGAYTEMKEHLRGGIITNARQYYTNFTHIQDWTRGSPELSHPSTDCLGGLSLAEQRKFDFMVTQVGNFQGQGQPNSANPNASGAQGPFNHFDIFITTRSLYMDTTTININDRHGEPVPASASS